MFQLVIVFTIFGISMSFSLFMFFSWFLILLGLGRNSRPLLKLTSENGSVGSAWMNLRKANEGVLSDEERDYWWGTPRAEVARFN